MSRLAVLSMPVLILAIVALGCAGYDDPSAPSSGPDLTSNSQVSSGSTQTHLWGYYDVYIDIPTQTATCILNRDVMWSANVVNFINAKPTYLGFNIKATPIGPDYVDVDIDVSVTHPFPGLSEYNGYDVRGVFIGDGSATLEYNPALVYSVLGNDQFMLNDPANGDGGGPDGYTRWYNPTEFLVPGVLGYTKGKFATPGYNASATLNPYKYFADGFNAQDDLWTWLNANSATHGVFSAGMTNTRNYYLRFPNAKGVKYAYAVVANWEAPDVHPSNAIESVATSTSVADSLYYVNPSNKGGDLILDIDVFNWSAAQMETQKLFIESSVLSAPHEFTPAENTPTGGNENYSTYHVEIPADNVLAAEGNEYWVIVQNPNVTYGNDFGVPNAASGDNLAAFFRYDLYVSPTQYCPDPTVTGTDPAVVFADASYDDLEITGTNLVAGPHLAVKLQMTVQTDIVGTDVKHVDDSTITADFNFTGAEIGMWDVVVTNGCGKVGIGAGLLEVFSCGTLSGFTTDYHSVIIYNYPGDMPTYLSGVAGTQAGTPYAISLANRTSSGDPDSFGYLAAIPTSTMNAGGPQYYSDQSGCGTINRDVVCDSQNRVYFTDAYDYSRLRYSQFNETTGFGPYVDFASVPSNWSIYRITIDEDDNPVLLATAGLTMRVFHWNGTSWATTDIPYSVFQGTPTSIGDFDWNPAFRHYVLLRKLGSGMVTLYAVNTSGAIAVTVNDIFAGYNFSGMPGIYIDVKNPYCDIVAWGSYVIYGTEDAPYTRMSAAYTGLVRTVIGISNWGSSNLNMAGPRGQVAKGSGQLCVAAHYINVYAKVPLPADW